LVAEAEKQGENLVKEAGSNPMKKFAAKQAADELVRQAEKQAENLLNEAQLKADEILASAKAEAEKI
jgi:vacuolar-type H+-ATPase subunit H